MTHNPLHRIAKLRRELDYLRQNMPDDWDVDAYSRRVWIQHRDDFFSMVCWVVNPSTKHHTEEHALKSAVRIARQKIAKMKRSG